MSDHKRPTHVYKGRCKECGAVLASGYDQPHDAKWTAAFVAEMITSGLAVTHEVFPGSPMSDCTCPKPEQQERLL